MNSSTTLPSSSTSFSDVDYNFAISGPNGSNSRPAPSAPFYDDHIFDELPGITTKSGYYNDDENVFGSMVSPPKSKSSSGLYDWLPGVATGGPARSNRPGNTNQTTSNVKNDPFVVLESASTPSASSTGLFTDPQEEIGNLGKSGNTKADHASVSGGVFDDINPLNGFSKSVPSFSLDRYNRGKDGSPSRAGSSVSENRTSAARQQIRKSSFRYSESQSQEKVPVNNFQESPETVFDMPTASIGYQKSYSQTASSPADVTADINEPQSQVDMLSRSEEQVPSADDIWLTVSEIPLFTQPTSAPPPSRPPPPIPRQASKPETGFFSSNARKKGDEFSPSPSYTHYSQSPKPVRPAVKNYVVSPIDELEDFAVGRARNNVDENADVQSGDEMSTNSAAAMKVAVDRAEAKFRHAKEVRERECAKGARNKEAAELAKAEQAMQDAQEREFRENQERLDRERQQREKEEEEKEQRRLEREREREREKARGVEREKGRQAVQRATREARERAATGAREKAAAEARLKAERAAVQRAQAEARERAVAEARERAEKSTAEAKEKENSEAREKEAHEKAAVARAEAEARRRAERVAVERATAEARDRAAAAAMMNQQKNDNNLESFFNMGSQASSAPKPRENSSDPAVNPQSQSRAAPDTAGRTSSVAASSNMRKASTTNIVDDLSSIFGGPSSGEFHEVEGESEERRRTRLERHQRTEERGRKAVAEKNQRELQVQREQEERHRIAETLDIEIKRWSAGKEVNLRALLSTLQYVLWPECGWQPVSLTDLITGASVKKVYRKATLCIHPDKVQQKGANLQQKYVAEKVFDLLKEAWNKFNSEELL